MSKNISILQDSEEKTLKKVEKIKTQLANGNVCYWVPEDEYPLGVLTVTEDGVYYPSTDPNGPYYGYSEINVSGIGTTTMGQLADIVITKNGTYESSTDSSGPYYGYAKVTVNVSGSGEGGGDGGSSSPTITGKDGDGDDAIVGTDEDGKIVTSKLPTRISINVYPNNLVYEDGQTIDFTGLRVKAFLPDGTEWGIVDDNELIKPVTVAEYSGDTGTTGESARATSSLLPDGVYVPIIPKASNAPIYDPTGIDPYGAIAWTMIYGNVEEMGSQQTIPLQWKRPGDKKVLETSFTIAVHGSSDSGSGTGPAPTPSPG